MQHWLKSALWKDDYIPFIILMAVQVMSKLDTFLLKGSHFPSPSRSFRPTPLKYTLFTGFTGSMMRGQGGSKSEDFTAGSVFGIFMLWRIANDASVPSTKRIAYLRSFVVAMVLTSSFISIATLLVFYIASVFFFFQCATYSSAKRLNFIFSCITFPTLSPTLS